jgi:hypothetical protein
VAIRVVPVPLVVDRLELRPVAAAVVKDAQSAKAPQLWDVVDPSSGTSIAHAEIYVRPDQWGVRLFDRAPSLDEADLTRIVAKLLVWHAACAVETVDLWLMRNGNKSTMVRVSGDYV